MNKKVILGAGTAGIITSLFTKGTMIDPKPLGELSIPFSPGIRIFKWDTEVVQFISYFLAEMYSDFRIECETLYIGYHDGSEVLNYATEDFKKAYSKITRGKEQYEPSFLSSGQTSINYVSINGLGYEGSYEFFFKSALEYLKSKGRLVEAVVKDVSISERSVVLNDGSKMWFNQLYSTIKLPILCKLIGVDIEHDFTSRTKCFYKTPKTTGCDMNGKTYVYSTAGEFTRKTEFKDYFVYETVTPHDRDVFEEGNVVEIKFENIPLQIKHSMSRRSHLGVELVGRYGQWNHGIKANEIIKRFIKTLKYKM